MEAVALFSILVLLVSQGAALRFSAQGVLSNSGDNLTVSWSGLESPSELDWIGVYNPADSLDDNFIGYLLLSHDSQWRSGKGSFQLPLVNMRAPYQFRLFKGVPSNSSSQRMDEDGNVLPNTVSRLAVSNAVQFKSFNEPTQVHLSLTSNAGEIMVMFVTRDPIECYIHYGVDEDHLSFSVPTKSVTYDSEDMCDSPANTTLGWRKPGYIHSGVIQRLKPSHRYFYQVGSKDGGWSELFSFVSPPEEGDETHAFLFGDLGTDAPYKTYLWTQAESARTLKWLQRDLEALQDKPAFVSHIGDISYARGYAWLWDEFFHRIQPVATKAPYMVCIGNHEYDWPLQPWLPDWAKTIYRKDGGGECGVPYSLRFRMPGNSSLATGTRAPATKNLYYSYTYGLVHFLYFSTETDYLTGSEQHNFIAADLQAVDRSKVPFVVVLGHRPMYTSNHELRDLETRSKMREHLEPLFVKNRVTLALWGHVHKYERICGMNNFTCGEGLPVHIVIGMAGQDWQPDWEPRRDHPEYPIFPQPAWSMFRNSEFGYIRLHATKELLVLSYVGNGDGQVHDTLEIPAAAAAAAAGLHRRRSFFVVPHPLQASVMWAMLSGVIALAVGLLVVFKLRYSAERWEKLEDKPPVV